jgi:hypothetical protein
MDWGGGVGGNSFNFFFMLVGAWVWMGVSFYTFFFPFFSKRVEPWARLWDGGERFSWLIYGC